MRKPEGEDGAALLERFAQLQSMFDGVTSVEEMAWRSGLGYEGVVEILEAFPARLVRVALPGQMKCT